MVVVVMMILVMVGPNCSDEDDDNGGSDGCRDVRDGDCGDGDHNCGDWDDNNGGYDGHDDGDIDGDGSDDCADGCPNCGDEVDDNGGGADGNNVVMVVPILAAIISTFTVYWTLSTWPCINHVGRWTGIYILREVTL